LRNKDERTEGSFAVQRREEANMRVIRAEALGMCFGVRDALQVLDEVPDPQVVTIHGELVHNRVVLDRLDDRGFQMESESGRGIPSTSDVLITAHGISDRERERLESAGKRLIDTTCPLVVRAHRAAQGLANLGYHVLVIGKKNHVEVRGIVEDLPSYDVIQGVEDIREFSGLKLGVICQTTAPERQVKVVLAAIEQANPHADLRFVDTVCRPTKQRQRALERLLDQVEAMVVVGGRNSNNTRELTSRCRERNVPVIQVADASELDPGWFREFSVVGLTAGTSTLPETVEDVYEALLDLTSPLDSRKESKHERILSF
jgi:4-hydroxy-3-methylbut-2-enyl diphosphate reductase